MTKQKINTPGLYPKDDFVKVIPTTEPIAIYFAMRHLYTDDKDVNDWYHLKKQKDKYVLEAAWTDVPSCENFDPFQTTNFRNGVK
jgi:hypothetical protein